MRLVTRQFGFDPYAKIDAAFERATSVLPPGALGQLIRTRQFSITPPKGAQGPVAEDTLHGLGIVKDASWRTWPYSLRERFARALIATPGIVVESAGAGGAPWKPGMRLAEHLHYGISRKETIAVGLGDVLKAIGEQVRIRNR